MSLLDDEIEANFEKFRKHYKEAAQSAASELEPQRAKFLSSYRQLVSLQAWRVELLERAISAGSFAFFLEAQNDALTSHVQA